MLVCESLAVGLFELKEKQGWTNERFLTSVARMSIQRRELSIFFDKCVYTGEMKPMDKMDPTVVESIRAFVKPFPLKKHEYLELGKCCALVAQLGNGDLFEKK